MNMIVEGEQMYILIKKERIYIAEMFLNWGFVTFPYEDDSRRRANVHIN